MLNATLAIAVAVAVVSARDQRTTERGNYSGLERTLGSESRHALRQAPPSGHPSEFIVLPPVTQVYETVQEDARGVLRRGPCGMPILVGDPSIDPKMVVPIPGSGRGETVGSTSEPPKCGPFAAVPARMPQNKPDGPR